MKKFFMIAVMTVVCMTASAQKMRHGAGQITVQPMIGLSSGYLRGEEETATGTVKYENNDSRTGLALGVEGEYYTTTPWLSVSAGLMYQHSRLVCSLASLLMPKVTMVTLRTNATPSTSHFPLASLMSSRTVSPSTFVVPLPLLS